MPPVAPRPQAPPLRRVRLHTLWLALLLAGCCHAPPQAASGMHTDLPEVGEAWPRRVH